MNKKTYTKSDNNTADKFFSQSNREQEIEYTQDKKQTNILYDTDITNKTNDNKYTHVTNITKQTNVTNKSKHYDKRGKRSERYGLLMDSQLKEDLRLLSSATGNKSVNDFIVTVLLNYVEQGENQTKLQLYKKLIEQ